MHNPVWASGRVLPRPQQRPRLNYVQSFFRILGLTRAAPFGGAGMWLLLARLRLCEDL